MLLSLCLIFYHLASLSFSVYLYPAILLGQSCPIHTPSYCHIVCFFHLALSAFPSLYIPHTSCLFYPVHLALTTFSCSSLPRLYLYLYIYYTNLIWPVNYVSSIFPCQSYSVKLSPSTIHISVHLAQSTIPRPSCPVNLTPSTMSRLSFPVHLSVLHIAPFVHINLRRQLSTISPSCTLPLTQYIIPRQYFSDHLSVLHLVPSNLPNPLGRSYSVKLTPSTVHILVHLTQPPLSSPSLPVNLAPLTMSRQYSSPSFSHPSCPIRFVHLNPSNLHRELSTFQSILHHPPYPVHHAPSILIRQSFPEHPYLTIFQSYILPHPL